MERVGLYYRSREASRFVSVFGSDIRIDYCWYIVYLRSWPVWRVTPMYKYRLDTVDAPTSSHTLVGDRQRPAALSDIADRMII